MQLRRVDKHGCSGCPPEQHQMTENNLQAGLEVLGLVYEEPERLLMAMEEDPSQWGAPETAIMWQLVKAWKMTILN